MKDLTNLKKYNAEAVLVEVNKMIEEYSDEAEKSWSGKTKGYLMDKIYDRLSIFDWWVSHLSLSKLKDMKKFLEVAIKLGFKGYVCFKVGATGCSNGMWAHKAESTDGYSPKGDCIYKSFTPAYNYWQIQKDDVWLPGDDDKYDSIKTSKEIIKLFNKIYNV